MTAPHGPSIRTPDVLVVGAGPAGLTTALQAHANGATVRVVERRPQPFRRSRAMIMHPLTLESLRPLGVTDELLDLADTSPRAELHLGRRRVTAELAEVALPDTPYPHLTLVRQMDVENVLAQALERRGVTIERDTELVDVEPAAAGAPYVRATFRADGRVFDGESRFLAGCDGSASTVRELTGIGWHGGTYKEEVVLADAELAGDLRPGVLHVVAGRQGLVFVFALGEGATWRVLATRPSHDGDSSFGQPGPAVPVQDVQRLLDTAGLEATVAELGWSARVRLQHRLAGSYRHGNVFLAGDAAHSHSPAAAQGMNTGILDAVNLGWKLAFAARAGDDGEQALLDSYERERRPVARRVIALTHVVFFAEASTHPVPAFLRGTLVPSAAPALPLLLRQRRLMAGVVGLLSQRWVHYRHSALSVEDSPRGAGPRPGDRLPDQEISCDGRQVRLHDLTARPGVHVLLSRDARPLDPVMFGPHVSVHRLTSRPGRGLAAVRPDGYVGYRCGEADPERLRRWLDLIGAPEGATTAKAWQR